MPRDIRLRIDVDRCQACLPCLAAQVCKVRAILRMDQDDPPFLAVDRCYDCRLCIEACPFEAIKLGIPA